MNNPIADHCGIALEFRHLSFTEIFRKLLLDRVEHLVVVLHARAVFKVDQR